MKNITFSKELPVSYRAQVVVCGGGTAGTFAAIAAAQSGKDVLVIEQLGSVGGSATNALVTPVMHTHIPGNKQCSYISLALRDRLLELNGSNETGLTFDPSVLRVALEQLCVENGVRLLYHTFISDVLKDGNKITGIVISNKAGLSVVEGDMFIDCTGDGDVCVAAGADYTKGDPETGKNQPISLRYTVGGVDIPALGEFFNSELKRTGVYNQCAYNPPYNVYAAVCDDTFTLSDVFNKAIKAGDLVEEDKLYWQMFALPNRTDCIAFNNPEFFEKTDGTDPDTLTQTHILGNKAILRQMAFYKKYFKGFENAYVTEVSALVGIRESRNIITDYVLKAEDMLGHKKFEDAICRSNYPVDVHGRKLNCTQIKKEDDDGKPYYEVPFRSLAVKGFENLAVAGRCLGAEFLAQSSVRVQHSCRSAGEAAGIGAAFALDKNIPFNKVDGKEVRAEMEKRGAEF